MSIFLSFYYLGFFDIWRILTPIISILPKKEYDYTTVPDKDFYVGGKSEASPKNRYKNCLIFI